MREDKGVRLTWDLSVLVDDDDGVVTSLASPATDPTELKALACRSLEELAAREDATELLSERVRVAGGLCARRQQDPGVLVVSPRAGDRTDSSLVVEVELLCLGGVELVVLVPVGLGRGRRAGGRRRGSIRVLGQVGRSKDTRVVDRLGNVLCQTFL